MKLTLARLGSLLVPCLLAGAAAAQASYTVIPGAGSATDITPDGEVVVGTGSGGGYFWRWKVDAMPTFIGGTAAAVSDDGSVICGDLGDQAAVWTQATGWVQIGGLPGAPTGCGGGISSAYDISGDGTRVVGLSWGNGTCKGRGFLWTQATGMQPLEVLANDNNRASAISGNGSVIAGFAQGNFSRTPAVWNPSDLSGDVFDADINGEVNGLSDDGQIALGVYDGSAFFKDGNDPAVLFGSLNPGWVGYASDIAEDTGRIVGFDGLGLGREAWVWSELGGFFKLQSLLSTLGVSTPPLGVLTAVSDDGTTMVGHSFFGEAYVVTLPLEPLIIPYGCGVNPEGSLSVLLGSPTQGTTINFGITNPLGTQPAGSLALMSFATQPAPGYPCGLELPGFGMSAPGANGEYLLDFLPPNPILTLIGPLWNGVTPAVIPLFIPSDPSLGGVSIYAQGVLYDFGLTSGIEFGFTDALRLRIGA